MYLYRSWSHDGATTGVTEKADIQNVATILSPALKDDKEVVALARKCMMTRVEHGICFRLPETQQRTEVEWMSFSPGLTSEDIARMQLKADSLSPVTPFTFFFFFFPFFFFSN